MPKKRFWLGIRLDWSNHVSLSRGEYRAARFVYNKQRLPWLQHKMATAAIFEQDNTLELFDTTDPRAVPGLCPFWKIDRYIFSLNTLAEFARWPTTEALYCGFTGIDLTTNYRAVFDANAFQRQWQRHGVTGWYVIERGGAGLSLVRELADVRDGTLRIVEVSCEGVTVYRHDLVRGSAMHDSDVLIHFNPMGLDLPRLRNYFSLEDVISIRQAVRFYHLVMYELAVDYELPF